MSEVVPVRVQPVLNDKAGLRWLTWVLRAWVLLAVVASSLAAFGWALSHRMGQYDLPRELWWRREMVGNEYHDITVTLRRDTYGLSVYMYTDRVAPEVAARLGRDPREPNLVDAGSGRTPGGLVQWFNHYRHQGENLRRHPALLARHLWHHGRFYYVHTAVPFAGLLALSLLTLALPPVRRAAGWWVMLPRRAAGGAWRARQGFPVGPPSLPAKS